MTTWGRKLAVGVALMIHAIPAPVTKWLKERVRGMPPPVLSRSKIDRV